MLESEEWDGLEQRASPPPYGRSAPRVSARAGPTPSVSGMLRRGTDTGLWRESQSGRRDTGDGISGS